MTERVRHLCDDSSSATREQRSVGHLVRLQRTAVSAAAVLLGLAILASACSSGSSNASPTTTAAPSGSGSGRGSTAPSGSATITIRNFSFSPSSITVSPGEKVTVLNKDSVAHTVTANDKKFNTGDIDPNKTVTFTAPAAPGKYPYICTIHQYMTGMLVVKG
jgi:plastocyanin